ncbi:guanine nucleotide-binding protein subunit gamma 2-like [Cucumis melo var. makuwa]|uniref:Guanine nucleotide-binding protein subunit gamma 2-like n=1 Tax=Cucumis melo var. makuwa TaxID=1194695 RepID=A0A5D3E5Y6_CUCMM|nr:guanine nucleotide-binding protein subunit gamma 2-like [Cucumis melo var. makuwa]TYK31384.1 guanine nucleotide-binding protein subunit gamma 2-like [Cucumis melo var. makuwa]
MADELHQSHPPSSPSPSPSPPPPRQSPKEEQEEVNPEIKSKSRCKNNTFFGRHRITAAINRLQNEINIIKEELQQLENIGESSTVCAGFISSVESIPDPLLPDTNRGRMFENIQNNRSDGCELGPVVPRSSWQSKPQTVDLIPVKEGDPVLQFAVDL